VRSGLFEANFPVENTGGEGGIRTLGSSGAPFGKVLVLIMNALAILATS
jgi:hypothetical protein